MASIKSGKGALGNVESAGPTTPISTTKKQHLKSILEGAFTKRFAERKEEARIKKLEKTGLIAEREKDLAKVKEVEEQIKNEQTILRDIKSGKLTRGSLESLEGLKKTAKEEHAEGSLPKETKEKREESKKEFERKSRGIGESKIFPKGFQKLRKVTLNSGETIFTSRLPEREIKKQNPSISGFTEQGQPIFKKITEEPEPEPEEKVSEEKKKETETEETKQPVDQTTSAVLFGGQGNITKRLEE